MNTKAKNRETQLLGIERGAGAAYIRRELPKQPTTNNELDAAIGEEVPVNTPQFEAPKVGTVKGGYVFKGGNPADPKNWKK